MRTDVSLIRDVQTGDLPPILFVFIFRGDWPRDAFELNLRKESDVAIFESVLDFIAKGYEEGWRICQFKDRAKFIKGRRLIGQHWQLIRSGNVDGLGLPSGVPIGRFQGLVEPLGYVRSRLSEESRKIIRLEYRRGASVAKLADEWDVSESLIRTILQGDKPPVSPLEKAINKGVSEPEPPLSGRVAKIKGGLTRVK
jgi:hypothetical protein